MTNPVISVANLVIFRTNAVIYRTNPFINRTNQFLFTTKKNFLGARESATVCYQQNLTIKITELVKFKFIL